MHIEMIQISVIIPTFNRQSTIKRAIDSALNQTLPPMEVIVIDDCSTDSTTSALSIYGEAIKVIRLDNRTNGAHARNVGIEVARGNYVAFLDSDDYWDLDKIRIISSIISGSESPNRTVYFHPPKIVDQRGDPISWAAPPVHYSKDTSISDYLFLHSGIIQTSCIVAPTELLIYTKFDARLKKHQDLDLCLRLAGVGCRFHYLPLPLTSWTQGQLDRVSNNSTNHSIEWANSFNFSTSAHRDSFLSRFVDTQLLRDGFSIAPIFRIFRRFMSGSITFRQLVSFSTEFPSARKIKLTLKGCK